MKKLIIGAMALALSAGVNANTPGGQGTFAFGEATTAQLVAMGVSLSVIAAIAANMGGVSLPDDVVEFDLICNQGGVLDNNTGVCVVTTTGTTTATVSVSGTVTNTVITVPVTSTYAPILVPR
ncbi:hypothetical protein [Arsukibacterium sp.]|uniref:hypothetical protein n=1 Tax=Arsukibacterium sp. TaxID=1977258 RepID=UPI003564DD11